MEYWSYLFTLMVRDNCNYIILNIISTVEIPSQPLVSRTIEDKSSHYYKWHNASNVEFAPAEGATKSKFYKDKITAVVVAKSHLNCILNLTQNITPAVIKKVIDPCHSNYEYRLLY